MSRKIEEEEREYQEINDKQILVMTGDGRWKMARKGTCRNSDHELSDTRLSY